MLRREKRAVRGIPLTHDISNANTPSTSSKPSYYHGQHQHKYLPTNARILSLLLLFGVSASLYIHIYYLPHHNPSIIKEQQRFDQNTGSTTKHDAVPVPFVHIVNTRFMQDQGNLTTLATARLHLFQTICLPSMLQQSSQNFLWFIKIDPHMDTQIKDQMVDMVEATHRENIFLIASNRNFLVGHEDGAWRGGIEGDEIIGKVATGQLYTGNVNLLHKAQIEAADAQLEVENGKFVLETRLDADDGLHEKYMEFIQKDAMDKFLYPTNNSTEKVGGGNDHGSNGNTKNGIAWHESHIKWFYWCASKHIKWYLGAEGDRGQLDKEARKNFCITPGLTVGFNIGTNYEDVPTHFGHHQLYKRLISEKNKQEDDGIECGTENCLAFVNDFVSAVRSRTPTSAGMADVEYREQNDQKSRDFLWKLLLNKFSVDPENLVKSKQYFLNNMKQIAKDNLDGQCRGAHSCKKVAKKLLEKIIQKEK